MVLRLDPDHPMVWRTPSTVQFGIEAPVASLPTHSRVFGGLVEPRELMLDLLGRGVARPVLTTLAAENGLPEAALAELLGELRDVLVDAGAPAEPFSTRSVAVDGAGPASDEIATLLHRMGAQLWPGPSERGPLPDVAVLVSHFVTDLRRAAVWLREDVPHLLVEFGERSVRVGPVVDPGAAERPGPCARCIEQTRTDADPSWPAIAVQALRRSAPSADVLGVATAAPVVARVLGGHLSGDKTWHDHAVRVRRPGPAGKPAPGDAVSVERVRPHPNCGCRSLPGIARAGALRCGVIRPPPTRGPDVPGRA
jgi:hypothetical protein